MKTVLETLRSGAPWLEKAGVESARLNMEHLLAKVLGCRRMQLYTDYDRPLSEEVLAPLRDLVKRRAKREPLQHLLGTVEFCGREYNCDARALIPRPETEELAEKIIARFKSAAPPENVLDMGTGSGVLGLALAHAWPTAAVTLADFSADALALAEENAALCRSGQQAPTLIRNPLSQKPVPAPEDDSAAPEAPVAEAAATESPTPVPAAIPPEPPPAPANITLVQTDLFAGLGDQRFDLIVANLPYIPASEIPGLEPEVRCDPIMALDGGPLGTELMTRFISNRI